MRAWLRSDGVVLVLAGLLALLLAIARASLFTGAVLVNR